MKDDILNNEGYYLLQISTDIYYGYISAPDRNITYEKFDTFRLNYTYNMISLNSNFTPQLVQHSSISRAFNLSKVGQQIADKMRLKADDVTIPFLGGIIGFDFRVLLKKWYDLKSKDIYDYKAEYEKYIKELFKKIKKDTK